PRRGNDEMKLVFVVVVPARQRRGKAVIQAADEARTFLRLVAQRRAARVVVFQLGLPLARQLRSGSAGMGRHDQLMTLPPSTFNVCAVMYEASSLARNTAAPAMSCGLPMYPRGTALPTATFFSPG